MKISRIWVVSFIMLTLQFACDQPNNYLKDRRLFKERMVKALGLRVISNNKIYSNARITVVGDTLIGYVPPTSGNEFFFVEQPLKVGSMIKFSTDSLIYPSISQVDDYKNGKLYFGSFGRSYMESLSTKGEFRSYFREYQHDMFYANKVIIVGKKAVVSGFAGVYVFDTDTQKLIWAHRYKETPYDGLNGVVDNKVILTEPGNHGTFVYCYDLLKEKELWVKWFKYGPLLYNEEYRPYHHIDDVNNNAVLTMLDACYVLNPKSEAVIAKISWLNYFELGRINPKFNFSDSIIVFNRHKDIVCKNIRNNQFIWERRGFYYVGLYKQKVIGVSSDMKYYIIINKDSGKIEQKIPRPESNRMEFQFIGKYILINHETICI